VHSLVMATLTVTENPVVTLSLSNQGSYYSMGEGTHQVSMSLHKENRDRLFSSFANKEGVLLLQGGKQKCRYNTDHEPLFRQESFFQWVFGVMEPDCYGILDLTNQKAILFVPRLPESYAVWMGRLKPLEEFREHYEVDEVRYTDEISQFISEENTKKVFLLQGTNSDSGMLTKPAKVEGFEFKGDRYDFTDLYLNAAELRVIKTPKEAEVLRYVARVSSEAHVACMRATKPGLKEYQLEATFLHHCYYHGGCRNISYTCICASGGNSAVLHYGHAGAPNDHTLVDGGMCLFDMGAEYHCYGADITCSFPVNGKFSDRQRHVYTAVYNAQLAVFSELKAGVSWKDMHLAAEKAILTVLTETGYLQGNVDDMLRDRLPAVFMPHGLGHFLGLDTHDVGGYLEMFPPRPSEPGLCKLRTAAILKEGMYLTVEPGVYFIPVLLEPAFADPVLGKYLVEEKIRSMFDFGGVRLEDDVFITASGFENFTRVPRKIEDVEAVMAGAHWDFDQLKTI